MKKFLLTLTAAIMSVAMCFGIAACSDDEPEDLGVAAESIELSDETVTLDVDGVQAFTYTVVPEDAKVKVEISDKTVVNYENDTLVAVTAGTATVKVYSVADTSVYAECAVTVNVPAGYTAYKANNYKFIYPTGWTKKTMSGVDVLYQNAIGSSINVVSSSKNDASWSISESNYKTIMTNQYKSLGYTVNSMDVSIKDDTYFGNKRRLVTCDASFTYIGVTVSLHQEQVLLQNSSKSYIMTVSYSSDYDADAVELLISQFAVFD